MKRKRRPFSIRKKKQRFPVDYKIEYVLKRLARKRYIKTFTPQEAIDQFWAHDDIPKNATIMHIYEWNKYVNGGVWDEVTKF